jgi:cobalt/nickel transport system ATP-binding protein
VTDLLLVGHGSRDPAAADEFSQLTALVRAAVGPTMRVAAGFLELAEPHVDDALDRLVADGATDIVAVPYVLFGAGHLKDDGPAILARARRRHPDVTFRLARDLGIHPAVLDAAEDRARTALKRLPPTERHAVVVVGRGSTDPDASADFVKFARLLEDGRGLGPVHPAFVAMTRPHLDDALDRARDLGAEAVTVVPLLLFQGTIVDRIATHAAAWADAHPDVAVAVAAHLGPDPRLADLVVERHRESRQGDVRMNCDVCAYRVRLPGYEEKVGTPLVIAPPDRGDAPRGWRARRAANQAAADAATRRERPRRGLGRRTGIPEAPDRRDGQPAIHIHGLHHTWPDGTDALAGVDLIVARGERLAVLGPNGSGKTTLALHLIGALGEPPAGAGDVHVTGLPVVAPHLADIRRRVGLVFQDPDDQLLLATVADDVALGPANLGLTGDALAQRVATALDVVGLTDAADRAPQHLSMGERRRAALAGVLATHPEVLVLDEPSANLDPSARRDVVEIVKGLPSSVTVLVITHDLPLALELCPRSVVIDRGRLVADGPTAALLANPALMAAHRLELPYGFPNPLIGRTPSQTGDN